MFSTIPLLNIDLGDAHVRKYRTEIFERLKYFLAAFMAFFIVCDIAVYVLTTRAIRRKKEEVFKLLYMF